MTYSELFISKCKEKRVNSFQYFVDYGCQEIKPCCRCFKNTNIILHIYDEDDEDEYGCFQYTDARHKPLQISVCDRCILEWSPDVNFVATLN